MTDEAGEPSQPKQRPAAAPKAFAFVNISNPIESGDAHKRKFVRQHVRAVQQMKGDTVGEARQLRGSGVAAVGLESGSLPFIVMSHPDQGTEAGTRRFVKQNVHYKKGRKQKGKGKEVKEEEEVEGVGLKKGVLEPVTSKKGGDVGKSQIIHSSIEDLDPLLVGSNRKESQIQVHNPLLPISSIWNHVDSSGTIFPIKMASAEYRLVEYLHSSSATTKIPPAFMPLWFGLILKDISSFQGLLSLALRQQLRCHNLPTEQVYRVYHSKALQSVRQRLANATQHTSSGLVTSVLIFLIHDILCEDEVRYKINRAGLRSIIALRGGIDIIDASFEQRVLVLVVEVCGAITFNYPLEYYIADALLYSPPRTSPILRSKRLVFFCKEWLSRYPERLQLVNILSDHYTVNAEVTFEASKLWVNSAALSPAIYLVIIRYFHAANHLDPSAAGAHLETSLCMASLIYLNVLRDAIGDYFTTLSQGLVRRLMDAVLPETEEWLGLEATRLWCLVQGGIVAFGEDRVKFLDGTRRAMRVLGCSGWDDAVEIVKEFIHVEQLFAVYYKEFGEDVLKDWDGVA